MRIETLVSSTAQQGFILWRDGDDVRFKGSSEMSPRMIDTLRQQKLELLAYLKLRDIAGEMDWQLPDLVDWYKDDLADIASMETADVRHVVQDYIKNLDLCRGEDDYLPIGELTPENEPCPVMCADCLHFIPDHLGCGGIGDCIKEAKQTRPLYPKAKRQCSMCLVKKVVSE